jgi:carbamate kinase
MSTPHELPPPAQLIQLVFGKCVTQAVSVAAHLQLADLLKDGLARVVPTPSPMSIIEATS